MTDPAARILTRFKRIAVVGCSATPGKSAHDVPRYMLEAGYEVFPVNPTATEIFGRKAYKSLAEVPQPVEVVDVFRPAPETPEVARQAAAVGAKALWLQTGIAHPEARAVAEASGMMYVEDRCVMEEHRRLQRR